MNFKLNYSTKFRKWIKKLDKPAVKQIIGKLESLRENPEFGKPLGNVLKNKRSLRIGKYRILYLIKGKNIVITKGEHRKKAYR